MQTVFGRVVWGYSYIFQIWLKIITNQYAYMPVHEISNNMVCATIKASDQPAHTRSLIRDFACRLYIL